MDPEAWYANEIGNEFYGWEAEEMPGIFFVMYDYHFGAWGIIFRDLRVVQYGAK